MSRMGRSEEAEAEEEEEDEEEEGEEEEVEEWDEEGEEEAQEEEEGEEEEEVSEVFVSDPSDLKLPAPKPAICSLPHHPLCYQCGAACPHSSLSNFKSVFLPSFR